MTLTLHYPVPEGTRVTQVFGANPDWYPISKGHNGDDFGTIVDTGCSAMKRGEVIVARNDGKTGYGRHVRIQHDDGISIYGHLHVIQCAVGDHVEAGQQIGLTGGAVDDPGSGFSTGPHLHAEYRLTDVPNPVPGGYVYNAIDILPLLEDGALKTYGVDTSHWDGAIDWLQIRQDGRIKFAIHKATEAVSIVDSQYGNNKAGCQAIGMPFAAYHFFRPDYDPLEQARFFYRVVGPGCSVYVVDVETAGTDLANKVKACCEELTRLGAPKVMIYTGPYFWRDNIGNVAWAKDYDLWIANYQVNAPMIPLPWTSYKIWQFGDHGSPIGDEDWFNGDINAVSDYFKNGNEVPEPTRVKVVNCNALTIRSQPLVSAATMLGYTYPGKIWTVEDKVQDANGGWWWRVGTTAFLSAAYCVVI